MSPEPLPSQRAAVRPRVTVDDGVVARLLDEEIGELLARGDAVRVQLIGDRGSGRTTALQHLAAVFAGEPRLSLVDVGHPAQPLAGVCVQVGGLSDAADVVMHLAPWSDDDVLDYLLALHRDRAAAALSTWRGDRFADGLGRWPGLCRAVLDHLAEGRGDDVIAALRRVCDEQLPGRERFRAREMALLLSLDADADDDPALRAPGPAAPLLASPAVRAQLAAERMVQRVEREGVLPLERLRWSPLLLLAVRAEVTADEAREQALVRLCGWTAAHQFASCLSLLCAAHPGFRPPAREFGDVSFAYLAGADLAQAKLQRLEGADLTAADLRGADLRAACACRARLCRARLKGARLDDLQGERLDGAMLLAAHAKLPRANLRAADLRHAVLDDADLEEAVLAGCQLGGASLRAARLHKAHLMHAVLDHTDLRAADCAYANLAGADLRTARLDGADLDFANLERSDLSGTQLPRLQARAGRFHAAILTGCRWPEAQLHSATFTEAGLAGVDWQGADLRAANFRNATFQFGGSRSGLVGSPIAGEGSRTGFYTDESLEDSFQAPEDVRKANLRFCDLRGAKLSGCDFYLVDLRGARLDDAQLPWLRRCRAILDRRAEAGA